jgi:hypothetical protein
MAFVDGPRRHVGLTLQELPEMMRRQSLRRANIAVSKCRKARRTRDLVDNFVGNGDEGRRDGQAQHMGGLSIDD